MQDVRPRQGAAGAAWRGAPAARRAGRLARRCPAGRPRPRRAPPPRPAWPPPRAAGWGAARRRPPRRPAAGARRARRQSPARRRPPRASPPAAARSPPAPAARGRSALAGRAAAAPQRSPPGRPHQAARPARCGRSHASVQTARCWTQWQLRNGAAHTQLCGPQTFSAAACSSSPALLPPASCGQTDRSVQSLCMLVSGGAPPKPRCVPVSCMRTQNAHQRGAQRQAAAQHALRGGRRARERGHLGTHGGPLQQLGRLAVHVIHVAAPCIALLWLLWLCAAALCARPGSLQCRSRPREQVRSAAGDASTDASAITVRNIAVRPA